MHPIVKALSLQGMVVGGIVNAGVRRSRRGVFSDRDLFRLAGEAFNAHVVSVLLIASLAVYAW